jgi:chromosome partitioning protein
MSYSISILNQKGGVGKTTTAVNLSACLAERGYKTLLIDSDPQCNASLWFGFKQNTKDTLFNLLLNESEDLNYDKLVRPTNYENLDIIISSADLYALDINLANKSKREFILKNRLEILQDKYDFILFDSPPNLGTLSVNLMTASNSIIVPLRADFLSLHGLATLLSAYKQMKAYLNPTLTVNGILLTMYSHTLNLCKEVEDDLIKNLGNIVFKTKIPQNIKIAESAGYNKPVIYYDPKCVGSVCYKQLTTELLNKINISK